MRTWTLKIRATDKKIFDQIKDGSKRVETRAGTIKYQTIEAGDTLLFVCGKERISKKVAKKYHFSSIEKMIQKIPFKNIMPSIHSIEEMKKIYSSFSGYEKKIKECGIVAFELET